MSRSARVIVASNRAADGTYADRSGPVIAEWLAARSYTVPEPLVVPDGQPVADALRNCLDQDVHLVLTTGGTGISPTDRTPEMTGSLLDYQLPGLADAVRDSGSDKVATAILSRGLAGVAGRTLIVNLPGSRGGVRDGLAVLDGVLEHAIEQLAGGDHAHSDGRRPGADTVGADVTEADSARSGTARVFRAEVTESPLGSAEHRDLVVERAAGAVVTFDGVVRDHDDGRSVRRLDYEAHPSAATVLQEVAAEVADRHTGTRGIAVSHRVGAMEVGDAALVCAVSAEHRAEAFATCAELVDEVKTRLPVWKHQLFTDGTDEWVNSP